MEDRDNEAASPPVFQGDYNMEQLVRDYGNDILRTAYMYVKDIHSAEDIFQEVFLKAYRFEHTFEGKSSVKTWLIRITINTCKDFLKSAYQNKVVPMFEFEQNALISEGEWNNIENEEDGRTIKQAVDELPQYYKDVIICIYYQDMSIAETAKMLEIAEGTVKSRLTRSKEILKKVLEGRL